MGAAGAPTTLMAGEIAFNEREKVLYYGSGSDGGGQAQVIIPIAGEGAFLPNPDVETATSSASRRLLALVSVPPQVMAT